MVRVCSGFLDSLRRNWHYFHTFLVSILTLSKKIKIPPYVIHFLNAKNIRLTWIHRQGYKVYGEHVIRHIIRWRLVRCFNDEWRKNQDGESGRQSMRKDNLVCLAEYKISKNKQFTITSVLLHFPEISHPLLPKIVPEKLKYLWSP